MEISEVYTDSQCYEWDTELLEFITSIFDILMKLDKNGW